MDIQRERDRQSAVEELAVRWLFKNSETINGFATTACVTQREQREQRELCQLFSTQPSKSTFLRPFTQTCADTRTHRHMSI
jgi:hypothetical protein